MIVLAHLNLVILILVATHPLFLAMITMLVPMTIVTLDLDVLTSQLNVMTTMLVPMTPAIPILDANM
jgi:hypothetical protein